MARRDLPTAKGHALQPRHPREVAMAADPAILKRIRACPFARGGRVLVRYRANGYSPFACRSGEPLARLRLTGESDDVVLLYPSYGIRMISAAAALVLRGDRSIVPNRSAGASITPRRQGAAGRLRGACHAARPGAGAPQQQSLFPGTPANLQVSAALTGAQPKRRSL